MKKSPAQRLTHTIIVGLLIAIPLIGAVGVFTKRQRSSTLDEIVSANETVTPMSYANTAYNYSLSYPKHWKVTTGDSEVLASPTSELVNIFDPLNTTGIYEAAITIRFEETLPEDSAKYNEVVINDNPMWFYRTPHGDLYYVKIPNTNQYLNIIADGGTSSVEENTELSNILASFRFTR